MKKLSVVIVEDEEILRETLKDDLLDAGYSVTAFDNPTNALEFLIKNNSNIILSDIRLPAMSGLDFLSKVKSIHPDIYIIMMTAYGAVENAVDAMKRGAYDYLTKPFNTQELLLILEKISEVLSLKNRNLNYQREFSSEYSLENFVGESDYVKELRKTILTVACSNSTILITGETGTGKELVANLIHYNSNRKIQPLIKVSCAILSREVIESELFGHEKGAFTGAEKQRVGRFETADGGTIYLDDIDDVPLDVQVKLLRVLQEQEIERVGSTKPVKIDVRVIASTKKNLLELAKQGSFREDLYYRLNVIPLQIKPLRERKEDIPPLFKFFVNQFAGKKEIKIAKKVEEILTGYKWNGNVRELKNIAERLVLMCNDCIAADNLPPEFFSAEQTDLTLYQKSNKSFNEIMEEIEIQLIKNVLRRTGGNKAKAAELLGLPSSTLKNKIEKLKIGI
ncbi:MAG: sigma-54 dependent transcriptional regulator [Bacteroidota bacterium]